MSDIINKKGTTEWIANQQRIAANKLINQLYPLQCNCFEVSNNGIAFGYTSDGSSYNPYFTIPITTCNIEFSIDGTEMFVYNNTILKTIMRLDFDNQSVYVVSGGTMSTAANKGAIVQFLINKI